MKHEKCLENCAHFVHNRVKAFETDTDDENDFLSDNSMEGLQ